MSKSSNSKVEIYKRLNKLKLKAGIALDENIDGYIKSADIRNAQAQIDEKEETYKSELEEILIFLNEAWKDTVNSDDLQRKKHLDRLYNYANNIKDLAETYNYHLMAHFGLSLRNFCEKIDISNQNHHVIVQAHVDVMWATFENNIKDDGGEVAQELKKMLDIAIKQNS